MDDARQQTVTKVIGSALGGVATAGVYVVLGVLLATGALALSVAGTAVLALRSAASSLQQLMYNVNLAEWEGPTTIEGNAYLMGCTNLGSLPPGLRIGGSLNLSECTSIRELPVGLSVGGNLILPETLASRAAARRDPVVDQK